MMKNNVKNDVNNNVNNNCDFVIGRNSVKDYLKSGKSVNKLFVQRGATGSINEIKHYAKENGVVIVEKDKSFFDKIGASHQGVAISIPPFEYSSIDEILEGKEKPFLLILDQIEDVNNLGAIIRTAECVGVDGIIIPKRGAAPITSTVSKVSEGAISNIKIAQVNNINDTILKLKDRGLWIIGTSLDNSNDYTKQDYDMPIAIVVGNEGKGISQKVLEKCDFKVNIPIVGKTQSLNVSVATGIILYEAFNKRKR